jgi:spore germination cell wall hydrolase CwlJ-like protein
VSGPAPRITPAARLNLVLALIALAALTLPWLFARHAPVLPPRPIAGNVVLPRTVVPPTVLPDVEPVQFQNVSPDDARAFNASVPFVGDGVTPARPYRALLTGDDLARATDCLAAAVLYEAGDDAVGERAVAQVILNRLHHPAFPKTVCGVVFQGSERATGCQFTFTCDGALRRIPGEAAWRRAREVAEAALKGYVYKPVGLATHYHTDWVVPYWQSSLDKIAQVHTHLFFRWTGWWGTPAAFRRTPTLVEPAEPQLAFLSDAHKLGEVFAEDGVIAATPFFGRAAAPLAGDANVFITSLNPAQAASFAAMAQSACGDRDKCKFMGWTDTEAMPFTATMSPQQMATMSFSYLRDRTANLERTLWNCTEFKRPAGQCMKRSALRMAAPAPADDPETAEPVLGPAELKGIRRKSGPQPVASPSPEPALTS